MSKVLAARLSVLSYNEVGPYMTVPVCIKRGILFCVIVIRYKPHEIAVGSYMNLFFTLVLSLKFVKLLIYS
jgi:hypothetical protein